LRWSDFRGAWMLGTVFNGARFEHSRNLHHALFYWYYDPNGQNLAVYDPRPGYIKVREAYPGISFQENSGMGRVVCPP